MKNGMMIRFAGNLFAAENGNICHICVPRRAMFGYALKVTLLMFAAYLLSVNLLMTAILVPVYIIGIYLYYGFWLICRNHGYRLIPVAAVVLLMNTPAALAAVMLRSFIVSIM